MVTSRKSRKRLEHGAIKRESISTVTVYDKKKKNKKEFLQKKLRLKSIKNIHIKKNKLKK